MTSLIRALLMMFVYLPFIFACGIIYPFVLYTQKEDVVVPMSSQGLIVGVVFIFAVILTVGAYYLSKSRIQFIKNKSAVITEFAFLGRKFLIYCLLLAAAALGFIGSMYSGINHFIWPFAITSSFLIGWNHPFRAFLKKSGIVAQNI